MSDEIRDYSYVIAIVILPILSITVLLIVYSMTIGLHIDTDLAVFLAITDGILFGIILYLASRIRILRDQIKLLQMSKTG